MTNLSNKYLFVSVMGFGLFLSTFLGSCHDKSASKNEVSIQIESPQKDQIVDNSKPVDLLINFSAEELIHKISIKITLAKIPETIVFNHNQLVHKTQVTFMDQVDLSGFTPEDQFVLKVTACGDHDCSQLYEVTEFFSL